MVCTSLGLCHQQHLCDVYPHLVDIFAHGCTHVQSLSPLKKLHLLEWMILCCYHNKSEVFTSLCSIYWIAQWLVLGFVIDIVLHKHSPKALYQLFLLPIHQFAFFLLKMLNIGFKF
jgi:hypothetical protein